MKNKRWMGGRVAKDRKRGGEVEWWKVSGRKGGVGGKGRSSGYPSPSLRYISHISLNSFP
jgi:hypothetical protein